MGGIEQQVQHLENEVKEVKDLLSNKVQPALDKIVRGMYGEEDNEAPGLIKNQKRLEDEIEELRGEIKLIHKKNAEQDIALKAKKSIVNIGLEVIKWAAVAYLVIDGAFGIDSLLKI